MEKEMTGADRRKEILSMIRDTDTPVSGTAIGRKTGVSRQVVVQDIALLRTQGYPIISTARGYLLYLEFTGRTGTFIFLSEISAVIYTFSSSRIENKNPPNNINTNHTIQWNGISTLSIMFSKKNTTYMINGRHA